LRQNVFMAIPFLPHRTRADATRLPPFLPWRPPARQSGPVHLGARQLYILPTGAGVAYGLMLAGLLLGAINYGLSLAYLFTFWFAALGVVGMLHTQRNLSGLVVRAGTATPVFAGETALFPLLLDNPGRTARRRVTLRHAAGGIEPVDVPAAGGARLQLAVPAPRRGWLAPGRFAVLSVYPLGLFRCWCVLELDWGVWVYPAPARDALPLPASRDSADADGSGGVEGDDFAGLRTYVPGDSSRRIAWKTVARGQAPLTKRFAGGGARAIWLDWVSAPERDAEARLSRLTRWVLDADAAGRAYGLRLPGQEIAPGTGDVHLRRCLEALARHEPR
jgi:uncharacterized protein (DUF58 family)